MLNADFYSFFRFRLILLAVIILFPTAAFSAGWDTLYNDFPKRINLDPTHYYRDCSTFDDQLSDSQSGGYESGENTSK